MINLWKNGKGMINIGKTNLQALKEIVSAFSGQDPSTIPARTNAQAISIMAQYILDFIENGGASGGGSGRDGKDGATYIPFVNEDGVLSWSNDQGLENPPTVNIKGPKGDKGDQGEKGEGYDIADWAKEPEKPKYTAQEVGAIPEGMPLKYGDFQFGYPYKED